MHRRIFLSFLLLVAAFSWGCEPAPTPEPPFTVRDSAGIEIVENFSPAWETGEEWVVDPIPVLQIGKQDGEEPYLFGRIREAVVLGNGTVAVLEYFTREIRIFDMDGEHLATIGGPGEGPGEFSTVPKMIPASGDTLLVWDPRQTRWSWFLADGTFLKDQRLSYDLRTGGSSVAAGWALAPSGNLLYRDIFDFQNGKPAAFSEEETGLVELKGVYHLYSALGEEIAQVADTFTLEQNVAWGESGADNPFYQRPIHLMTHPPLEIVLNDPEKWQLNVYGTDGSLKRLFRAAIKRRAITDEMIDKERDDQIEFYTNLGLNWTDVRMAWTKLPVADSLPAIDNVYWDGAEHFWVQRLFWDQSDATPIFDVVNKEGRWMGLIEIPSDFGEILTVTPEYILTLWHDDLDVPYVRVYRIDRSEPE